MKSAFYFTLKSHFVPKMSQIGKQTFAIRMFSNTSRSKGNQTMTFSQLFKYNMRNIFLEKSYAKCGGEAIPRPFSENIKLCISLDQ